MSRAREGEDAAGLPPRERNTPGHNDMRPSRTLGLRSDGVRWRRVGGAWEISHGDPYMMARRCGYRLTCHSLHVMFIIIPAWLVRRRKCENEIRIILLF